MMPAGLLDKIKSGGFIRVVIRPTVLPETLTTTVAREVVQKSSVSLRGWDFPHIAYRNDEQGGSESHSEFAQEWCDWHHHVEFWRMYKSGQFLHYKALQEDLRTGENAPTEPSLGIGGFMFTATELTEFAHRLRVAGLYKDGAEIHLTLGNMEGRRLWVEDRMRGPFMYPMITSSDEIKVTRVVGSSDLLLGDPKDISQSMISEVFDAFGWNPSAEQIRSTQDELYGLRLGRGRDS